MQFNAPSVLPSAQGGVSDEITVKRLKPPAVGSLGHYTRS